MPWAKEFHQYITCDTCGLVPDRLSSVGFLRAFRFPLTSIMQIVNGLEDWIQQGLSASQSVIRWRLTAIEV